MASADCAGRRHRRVPIEKFRERAGEEAEGSSHQNRFVGFELDEGNLAALKNPPFLSQILPTL